MDRFPARLALPVRSDRLLTAPVVLACLFATGCVQRVYGPPAQPPPAVSAMIADAQQAGYRAGFDDGARDAVNGFGYHPRRDRKFTTTPGYERGMGPYGPYRDSFRDAYLRGYAEGFRRR